MSACSRGITSPQAPRRILLAAATAFAERGFRATTTRDIAALAGLSSAGLYVYFRSKEEVLYQISALTPAHLADITAKQRQVGRIVRQVIADGMTSGDFDVTDPGATAIAILSLCLDVARWYRPGYRRTPQQLGDSNAAAALRIVGSRG